MGESVSRVGDVGVGTCPNHPTPVQYVTTFVTGLFTGTANDQEIAYVGTVGNSTCGHPTIALSGSTIANGEDSPIHRVGDVGANFGPYTSMSGSPDFTSE